MVPMRELLDLVEQGACLAIEYCGEAAGRVLIVGLAGENEEG